MMTMTWGKPQAGLNYSADQLAEFKTKHGIENKDSEWEQQMADAKKRIAERQAQEGQ
jgi:hypothetical protein